jgi:hypothetical protein
MEIFMLANRTKLIVSLFLGFLLCIFGCIGFAQIAKKGSEGQAPISALRITIDVSRREELFDQLQKFASKHSFRLLIRDVEVIPKGIFIEMYRDDIEIHAGSDASDPTMIDLGIYERDPKHPTQIATVDVLVSDLRSFISEIPNVTITEEK